MDNQPLQSTPPPSNQPSKTFLLILGAIVLMVISGVGGYYLGANRQSQSSQPTAQYPQTSPTAAYTISPTTTSASLVMPTTNPSITANWKTYTNTEHAFSLKHPNSWIVQSKNQFYTHITVAQFQSLDFVLSDSKAPCCVVEGAEKGMLLEITAEGNPNFKSYEDLKYFKENLATDHLQYSSKEEIVVAGQKAMLKKFDKPFVGFMSISYFYMNGNIYQFTFKSSDNQDVIFNQILSTFKFTQ